MNTTPTNYSVVAGKGTIVPPTWRPKTIGALTAENPMRIRHVILRQELPSREPDASVERCQESSDTKMCWCNHYERMRVANLHCAKKQGSFSSGAEADATTEVLRPPTQSHIVRFSEFSKPTNVHKLTTIVEQQFRMNILLSEFPSNTHHRITP